MFTYNIANERLTCAHFKGQKTTLGALSYYSDSSCLFNMSYIFKSPSRSCLATLHICLPSSRKRTVNCMTELPLLVYRSLLVKILSLMKKLSFIGALFSLNSNFSHRADIVLFVLHEIFMVWFYIFTGL